MHAHPPHGRLQFGLRAICPNPYRRAADYRDLYECCLLKADLDPKPANILCHKLTETVAGNMLLV